jgi:Rieske 2Fe-2S family protein
MFVVAHVDYVRAVSLMPLGPEETRLTIEWYFARETLDSPGFDLSDVTDFATTVVLEDGAACEINQRGLKSSRFKRGRLMPQEFDIYRFHQWVLGRLAAAEV